MNSPYKNFARYMIVSFSVVFLHFQYTFASGLERFHEAIDYVVGNSIMSNHPDKDFKSDQKITRTDFLKSVLKANFSEKEIIGNNCFPDVKNEDFAKYVCFAKTKNIISGYPDGYFRPEQSIVFSEATKILVRIFNFSDHANSNDLWFKPLIKSLSKRGLISDTIQSINHFITRGETADMIWRIKNNIFYQSSSFWQSCSENTQCDLGYSCQNQFCLYREEDIGYGFRRYGKYIKYLTDYTIDGIDAKTAKPLSERDIVDKYHAYTLEAASDGFYIVDGADPVTFESLDKEVLRKDKNHVFSNGNILKDADPKTFQILSGGYAKDKYNYYYYCAPYLDYCFLGKLSPVDKKTFSVLNQSIAKDKNNVYFESLILKNADPATFVYKPIDLEDKKCDFYIDKNNIFSYCFDEENRAYFISIIDDADPESFKFLNKSDCTYMKDHARIYYLGEFDDKILNITYSKYHTLSFADPTTFQVLKDGYAKDKNHVYQNGKILEGISPATFQP